MKWNQYVYPSKTNMTMEKVTINEDVSPIENGDFPVSHVSSQALYLILFWLPTLVWATQPVGFPTFSHHRPSQMLLTSDLELSSKQLREVLRQLKGAGAEDPQHPTGPKGNG